MFFYFTVQLFPEVLDSREQHDNEFWLAIYKFYAHSFTSNSKSLMFFQGSSAYFFSFLVKLFHFFFFFFRGIDEIDLSQWKEIMGEKAEEADLKKFVKVVHENHFFPNTVLVDCTADSNIANHYYDWLCKGIHVITPNKKANSGPLDPVTMCL